MAIKILDRLYNEIFTDGQTDWLLGNVGDWQKLKLKCEVAVEYLASQQTPIQIDYVNNAFILSSGEKWGDYGFDDGMTVVFRFKKSVDTTGDGEFDQVSSTQQTYTITNIYASTMEVQESIEADEFETVPTNFGSKKITDVLFYVSAIPEGCRITYGHITNDNSESDQLNSFIDNTESEFAFPGLNNLALGNWGTMEAIGMQSGMSIRSCKVREVPNNTSGLLTSFIIPQASAQTMSSVDLPFSSPTYDSIRSVKMNIENAVANYQSVTNDNLIPQSNSTSDPVNGANSNQAFLFDANGAYTQEFLFNVNFRITDISNDVGLRTPSNFRVVVLRYTNGASMDYVERITLQEWTNVSGLINQNLSVNGIYSININDSDSLILAMEYYELTNNNRIKTVQYIMNEGFVQASNPDQTLSGTYKRHFEFELEYMISSLFEELADFENLEMPSYLTGDGSLTDNFKIEFYPEWNNPNVKIQNDMTKTRRLGNTGWFNENFNELNNDFQIDSIQYFDINGNPVDSLDYSAQTKVKAIISGVPNLGANTECGFGFAWIPSNEEDYKEKETPFYRNLFVQSGSLADGFSLNTLYTDTYTGAGLNGGSIDTTQVRFTSLNGKIIFEATFVPNASFFNIFDAKSEEDRNYILWISVADGNLVRNFSDRVSLLADFGTLVKNIPPAGAYDQIDNAFIEHPFDETVTGETNLQGIVQDDILCRMPLRVPTDGSKLLQRIAFGVEAFNIGLNQVFELERFEIDLTQFPLTSDGIQQFNIDTTRGFKLEPGNNKNWVKIQRETNLDTSGFAGFLCFFGTKIRWEDWIQNIDAPNAFFDSDELNNGFHNDWVHYLRTEGWSIKFFAEIISNESGDLYEYRNRWNMDFNDYDENENVAVTHQYFRDSDDTLLNVGTDPETGRPLGVILSNEPTRIEIEFEILDSGTWDLPNTYGVATIEIDKGAGRFEMRQLSSVWGSENDNPLKPLTGETKLKMEVDGTNKFLKLSCLIDPDLLQDAERYRITGRVGCYNDGGTEFSSGLYEFRYEETYE